MLDLAIRRTPIHIIYGLYVMTSKGHIGSVQVGRRQFYVG